jgi:hypothetical protein
MRLILLIIIIILLLAAWCVADMAVQRRVGLLPVGRPWARRHHPADPDFDGQDIDGGE